MNELLRRFVFNATFNGCHKEDLTMHSSAKKIGLAAAAALTFAAVSAAPANAHWYGYGHGYGYGYHAGPSFSFSFGAPYYRPYYAPAYSYGYGGECFLRRRVVINEFGERIIINRRVCY